jgi:predicted MPP superfamily phosphohydrolase
MPAPILLFLLISLIEFGLDLSLGARSRSGKDREDVSGPVVSLRELSGTLFAYWLPSVVASAVLIFVAPSFFSGASIAILLGLLAILVIGKMLRQRCAERSPDRRLSLYLVHLLTLVAFGYFCFGAIMASGFLKSRALPKAQQRDVKQLISTPSPASCEFVALSDFHIKAPTERAGQYKDLSSPANLQSLLDGLPCKPKLLLISGDLTDRGDPRAWAVLTARLEKSAPGMTVLAAPGNHDIFANSGSGRIAGMAGSYLRFVAEKAPEIQTRSGRKLADELNALQNITVTQGELKDLQEKADEEWYVFAPRDWRGKRVGSPPALSIESVLQARQEQFWNSLIKTTFPLFWIDADSQTAVLILNSSSGQKHDRTAFGDIDDDQLRALASLLDKALPAGLKTILVVTHHPATGRSNEILGSGPDRWWFPWAWRGTEIYEYGTLGSQTTSGQKLLAILEKTVEQRPNVEFALVSGHRHSLWIGKYGPIWILDPPSLAREYSDPKRAFPAANRVIAGWHEDGRLRIALLPKSGTP